VLSIAQRVPEFPLSSRERAGVRGKLDYD